MLRLGEKIRAFFAKGGYTCDACGREVFSYPQIRLCADCSAALKTNTLYTCEKCGRETRSQGVCLECKRNLPSFDRGYSAFVYAGFSASIVNRLKNGARHLSNFLGEKMSEYLASRGVACNDFLVISVPTTEEKLCERGYNQAEELAQAVAKNLGLVFDKDVLVKTRETAKQKEMTAKERRDNVEGAYRVSKRKAVRGRRILLVDDIMTTGATGSECARVLKNAGASEVVFLTAVALREPK